MMSRREAFQIFPARGGNDAAPAGFLCEEGVGGEKKLWEDGSGDEAWRTDSLVM